MRDEGDPTGADHDQLLHTQRDDGSIVRVQRVPVGLDRPCVAEAYVAVGVGVVGAEECVPGPDVVPVEGGGEHRHPLGALQQPLVDGKGGNLAKEAPDVPGA